MYSGRALRFVLQVTGVLLSSFLLDVTIHDHGRAPDTRVWRLDICCPVGTIRRKVVYHACLERFGVHNYRDGHT